MPTITLPGPSNTPPRAARPTPRHDWAMVSLKLRANPGVWQLMLTDFSTGAFSYLRNGKVQALAPLGGQLHMTMKRQRDAAGDLWLMWTPAGWTAQDQERVDASIAAGEAVL